MNIEILKDEMKRQGLNQIKLAEISGIPLQTIRNIFSEKTKNPRIDTIQNIERALNINEGKTKNENYLIDRGEALITMFNSLSEKNKDIVENLIFSLLEEKDKEKFKTIVK